MEENFRGIRFGSGLMVYPDREEVFTGSGKLSYETPAVTSVEVKLECSIASGSPTLKGTNAGDFQIEDYGTGGDTVEDNINLL